MWPRDDEFASLKKYKIVDGKIVEKSLMERVQVSAWEDDDDGVESDHDDEESDPIAMLNAAEKGNLPKIKNLLRENRFLVESRDKDHYTPLHRASYSNHVEIVEFLIKMGAKLNTKTLDEWQPLHSACYWNNTKCAEILIANGADINAKSKGDQTPLHLVSASSHNSSTLQLLLLHPDINPHIVNSSGDTADQIARRTTKYYPLYEIVEPCLNEI